MSELALYLEWKYEVLKAPGAIETVRRTDSVKVGKILELKAANMVRKVWNYEVVTAT